MNEGGVPAPNLDTDPLAPARALKADLERLLTEGGVPLGLAELRGGAKVPAINVGNWGEGTVTEGLEVIVSPNAKLKTPPGFAFLGFEREFSVKFINNGREPDILEAAAQAIAQKFHPFESFIRMEESPDTCELLVIGINPDQTAD